MGSKALKVGPVKKSIFCFQNYTKSVTKHFQTLDEYFVNTIFCQSIFSIFGLQRDHWHEMG